MNENLDIFISTHKDFSPCPNNKVYKIITDRGIDINTSLDVLYDENTDIYPRSFNYAEGSRIYWVWKNYPLKKYVGFCHYRSYFNFEGGIDNIPNMDDIFSKYKVITLSPTNIRSSIYSHYKQYHNIKNLNYFMNNNCFDNFDKELKNKYLYIRNMFIMKKEDFLDYCSKVFPMLLDFDKNFNLKTRQDVVDFCYTGFGDRINTKNFNLTYQSRIEGFLLERFTSMYISSRFNKDEIKTYDIKWTEKRIWT